MIQYISGNHVALLCNGSEYFPALAQAINKAKKSIYLQTYIFELDKTGLHIGELLKKAAMRGVNIYLLLDGFGCKDISKKYVEALEQTGITVLFFRPKISPWSFKLKRLRRMHRKMVVIDNEVGFVGGINIIDDYNTPSHIPPRIDYAAKAKGPIVAEMQASMELLWYKVSRAYLGKAERKKLDNKPVNSKAGNMQVALVIRDNLWRRYEIRQTYLSAIKSAKSEIIIASAYFLPSIYIKHALRDAAKRGVRVTLLLQKKVEYALLDFASHGLYSWLLNHNIEIYEYHKSFMHSKVAVVDQNWAMVGSANIDPFSLLLSREANIAVNNVRFAQNLKKHLLDDINVGAKKITADEWQKKHYIKRFLSWVIYSMVRFTISILEH